MVNTLEELYQSEAGHDTDDGDDDDPDIKDEALLKIDLHVSVKYLLDLLLI